MVEGVMGEGKLGEGKLAEGIMARGKWPNPIWSKCGFGVQNMLDRPLYGVDIPGYHSWPIGGPPRRQVGLKFATFSPKSCSSTRFRPRNWMECRWYECLELAANKMDDCCMKNGSKIKPGLADISTFLTLFGHFVFCFKFVIGCWWKGPFLRQWLFTF